VTPRLQATLKHLPDKPGVYLLKDESGRVLYVGKAQSLRNRVRQYWQAGRSAAPLRIESAIDQVTDVETTLTDTVSEALLLEANHFGLVSSTADMREGMAAFLEKRKAAFQGR